MKVASSQYKVKPLQSYQQFEEHVRWHLDRAAEQGAELLLLPEFLSVELLTLHNIQITSMDEMNGVFKEFAKRYSAPLMDTFSRLAKEYSMLLAAGTHFMYYEDEDKYYNSGLLFTPDGRQFVQNKIHPSYELVYNKSITSPGTELGVFEERGVKYGVSVCYDGSFPEIGRILGKLGADVLLAPTCCLDDWGKNRNVLFSQARATENQVFVINSHLIGALPFPTHIPYGFVFTGQSGIYSPIQPMIGTSSGIVKQGEPNVEMVVVADIDVDYLRYIREHGHNRNLKDMRPEFYQRYA